MGIFVGTAWVGRVCLAALVLLANVPHFVCRCPDGRVKSFCLGSPAGDSGCCCGGKGCCADTRAGGCCHSRAPARATSHRPAPCCATAHQSQQPQPQAPPCQGSGGCTRTVAPAENYTPTKSPCVPRPDLALAAVPPASPAPVDAPEGSPQARRTRSCLSPPPDLVKLLQHLLI